MGSDETRLLYRFEYLSDGERYTDWVWLEEYEVAEYLANDDAIAGVTCRRATSSEMELYDEAYNDGYDVAMIQEIQSAENGITFRVELSDDPENNNDFVSHKMFECGVCGEHKDFGPYAATANGFYVGVALKDMLWYVCFSCAFERLEDDDTSKSEANS